MIPVRGVNESTLVTRLINALSITFVFLQIFGGKPDFNLVVFTRVKSKHSTGVAIVKSSI